MSGCMRSAPSAAYVRFYLWLKLDPVTPNGAELGVPNTLEHTAVPLDCSERSGIVDGAHGQQPIRAQTSRLIEYPAQRPGGDPAAAFGRADAVPDVAGPLCVFVVSVAHGNPAEDAVSLDCEYQTIAFGRV